VVETNLKVILGNHSCQINEQGDFAEQLERAVERSRMTMIEAKPNVSASNSQHFNRHQETYTCDLERS